MGSEVVKGASITVLSGGYFLQPRAHGSAEVNREAPKTHLIKWLHGHESMHVLASIPCFRRPSSVQKLKLTNLSKS